MSIQVNLVENDVKSFKTAVELEMDLPLKHFEKELLKIRTGRAHHSLIEDIAIACYGQAPAPLRNYASISVPDTRLIVVQPWDVSVLNDIEKGLKESDLGVNPVNDGKVIKIQLPEMSGSRREELVKNLGKRLEDCRTAIRNVRKEFHNIIRDGKKDKKISEDFHNRLNDELQAVTDAFIKKADDKAKKKEDDIKTV
jgi:ribosome recycling factor